MQKVLSKLFSYLFHPINFALLGAFIYFLSIPKYISKEQEQLILVIIFLITYVFPLILLFLLKKFKMVESYKMDSIEERKFPTLLFITLTFIIGNWLYKSTVVDILSIFYFGYGLALLISYILLQLNMKISLHATAVSGLIGFVLYYSYYFQINLLVILAPLFILCGLIITVLLKARAHKLNEVVYGSLVGFASQLLIFIVYYNM